MESQGGGCSGLSYNIRFDTQPRERDRIYKFQDVRVFIDPKSFIYLHGMILDYEETLMRQGFNFINPNSTQVVWLRLVVLSLGHISNANRRREISSRTWRAGRAPHRFRTRIFFAPDCGKVQPASAAADYFEVFGLPRKLAIDTAALERSFYRLSRKLHPDVYARATEQEQEWSLTNASLLNDAYRTLKDPISRTEYLLRAGRRRDRGRRQAAGEIARLLRVFPPICWKRYLN